MKDLLVFLANGFEEIEALTVVDFLRRAELTVETVSIYETKEVKGAHDIIVVADEIFSNIKLDEYRGLYILGGLPGATNLKEDHRVVEAVKTFNRQGKITAAICAGPTVLDRAGLLESKKFTCFPGYEGNLSVQESLDEIVVKNGTVITGMGPALEMDMAFTLIEVLKNKETADAICEEVLYQRLVKEHKSWKN